MRIRVAGCDIPVRFRHSREEPRLRGCWGLYDETDGIILHRDLRQRKHYALFQQILLHELVHAALHRTRASDGVPLDVEERFVTAVTEALSPMIAITLTGLE